MLSRFELIHSVDKRSNICSLVVDASLDALSQYCAFVFANSHKDVFADLNQRLGVAIQVKINSLRHSMFVEDSSWYGACVGVMRTFGMDNVS